MADNTRSSEFTVPRNRPLLARNRAKKTNTNIRELIDQEEKTFEEKESLSNVTEERVEANIKLYKFTIPISEVDESSKQISQSNSSTPQKPSSISSSTPKRFGMPVFGFSPNLQNELASKLKSRVDKNKESIITEENILKSGETTALVEEDIKVQNNNESAKSESPSLDVEQQTTTIVEMITETREFSKEQPQQLDSIESLSTSNLEVLESADLRISESQCLEENKQEYELEATQLETSIQISEDSKQVDLATDVLNQESFQQEISPSDQTALEVEANMNLSSSPPNQSLSQDVTENITSEEFEIATASSKPVTEDDSTTKPLDLKDSINASEVESKIVEAIPAAEPVQNCDENTNTAQQLTNEENSESKLLDTEKTNSTIQTEESISHEKKLLERRSKHSSLTDSPFKTVSQAVLFSGEDSPSNWRGSLRKVNVEKKEEKKEETNQFDFRSVLKKRTV